MPYSWDHTVCSFLHWLLPLSNMHLSFLCVSSWLDDSFLFSTDLHPSSGWIAVYLSIHLLRDILVASKSWLLWMKLWEPLCAGCCMGIGVQHLWINQYFSHLSCSPSFLGWVFTFFNLWKYTRCFQCISFFLLMAKFHNISCQWRILIGQALSLDQSLPAWFPESSVVEQLQLLQFQLQNLTWTMLHQPGRLTVLKKWILIWA